MLIRINRSVAFIFIFSYFVPGVEINLHHSSFFFKNTFYFDMFYLNEDTGDNPHLSFTLRSQQQECLKPYDCVHTVLGMHFIKR